MKYGPSHEIDIVAGGLLHELAGSERWSVNSLHRQGIDRLGTGLTVEAKSDDGLVEAFRVAEARGFNLAVQWHPEWKATEDALSTAMFRAFGDACRARAAERQV